MIDVFLIATNSDIEYLAKRQNLLGNDCLFYSNQQEVCAKSYSIAIGIVATAIALAIVIASAIAGKKGAIGGGTHRVGG